VDAKAMGIVHSNNQVQPIGRKFSQGDQDQNYMVKVTETYNPNTQISEDQTLKVSFTRVSKTETTELQTGIETYVASADLVTIEKLLEETGHITIKNIVGHEFRLLNGDIVVQDWTSSDQETFDFVFDNTIVSPVIESRSLDASISFICFEGFSYSLYFGDSILFETLVDNGPQDKNEAAGSMTISGLTEGLAYDIHYSGYRTVETITQDEVDGQVDKLYVIFQYTYISFVPLNLSQRPQDKDLALDYDGIPLYDKTGYFSDSTRQSFVVDNNTGLIYKIENINISNLSGGCASVVGSQFPYAMKITENNDLEFYSLFQNSSINMYSCFVDKHNNKYVKNNKINMFDSNTNTFYYVFENYSDEGFNRGVSFFPTNIGTAIKVEYDQYYAGRFTNPIIFPLSYKIVEAKGALRTATPDDNFLVYTSSTRQGFYDLFKVQNGRLLGYLNTNLEYFWLFELTINQSDNTNYSRFMYESSPYVGPFYKTNFLKSYDVVLEFYDRKLYYYSQFFSSVIQSIAPIKTLIIEDVDLEDGKILRYGLAGNTYFEIVPEISQGTLTFKAYETGSYVAPPQTSVTLQPINK